MRAQLDWIAAQPGLDKDRVMVTGGSHGGYMTLACMTHFNACLPAHPRPWRRTRSEVPMMVSSGRAFRASLLVGLSPLLGIACKRPETALRERPVQQVEVVQTVEGMTPEEVQSLVVPARNSWIIRYARGHHVAGVWGHASAPSGVTALARLRARAPEGPCPDGSAPRHQPIHPGISGEVH